MYLDRYGLSKWEKDILLEFFEDSLNFDDLIECVSTDYVNNFLIRLADDLNSYKSKLTKVRCKGK